MDRSKIVSEILGTIKALDYGLAETHLISDGQKQVIIVVFNLKELSNGLDELVGAIAHETVHVIDRISEYIGDESEFSSETKAYLTETIVKQIFKACVIEKENHARKTCREILQTGDRESGRADFQMDKHSDGRAGQDSVPQQQSASGGAKGKVRPTISKTVNHIQGS